MNQTITDGVEAVRATSHRVRDRVETAAGEVRKEAHEARERLMAQGGKGERRASRLWKRGRDGVASRVRGRVRTIAAATAGLLSVAGIAVSVLVRRKRGEKK